MTSDFVQILYQKLCNELWATSNGQIYKKAHYPLLTTHRLIKKILSLQYERQEIHSASQWRYRHGFLGFVIYLVDTSLQISESYHYDFLPSYHIERFLGNDIISRKDAESQRLKDSKSQSRRV